MEGHRIWNIVQLKTLLLLCCIIIGHQSHGWKGLKITDGNLEFLSDRDRNINLKTIGRSFINIDSNNIFEVITKVQRSSNIVERFKHNEMLDLDQYLLRIEQLVGLVKNNIQHLEQITGIGVPRTRRPIRLRFLFLVVRYIRVQFAKMRKLVMRDECLTNPCHNGGTCLDRYDGFLCLCPRNWEGITCEEDVNECANFAGTDLGCQNNAICTNLLGSYKCECQDGWIGMHCIFRKRDCDVSSSEELCGNGHCINLDGRIACLCNEGWSMDLSGQCTVDLDECAGKSPVCSHDPLVECYNLPGSFHCGSCPAGYSGNGYQCRDINECEINNGGCSQYPKVLCINTKGSYVCGDCPPGYSGDGKTCLVIEGGICNYNNGGCHEAAFCILSSGTVECQCRIGFTGDGVGPSGCQPNSNMTNTACSENLCKNGGTCIQDLSSTYKCICLPSYTGLYCDTAIENPCDNKPCQNGGVCTVTSFSSVNGFKCSCQFGFTGDTCEFATNDCVGSVNLNSGTLIYPSTDSMTSYSRSELCHWQITVNSMKLVQVIFNSLHISSDTCASYIQIYDGSTFNSKSLGKLCSSNTRNPMFRSTTNIISIYANLTTERHEKFELSWTSINASCVNYITLSKNSTIIESPGFPHGYGSNLNCFWHLTAPEGKQLDFVFYTLSIENSLYCHKDFLKIFDHDTINEHALLQQYCNISQLATPLRSSSHQALLYFHSDDDGLASGFRIGVHTVQGCGDVLTDQAGEIITPMVTGKDYKLHENNLYCEWKIQLPVNNKIKFYFTQFDVEECGETCNCDYVEIHDGLNDGSSLVGKYCGNILPSEGISSSNILTVIFKSDVLVNKKGFILKYETFCGGYFTGNSGELMSPNYPQHYPGEIICNYFIEQPAGKIIKIQVNDFDIEHNDYFQKCFFDFLEIYDGLDSTAPLIGTYCGGMGKIPQEIISKFNHLYLKFSSDDSNEMKGFRLTYSTIDVVCGGIVKDKEGVISSPLEDNAYPPNTRCTWLIVAPIGYSIHINWISFHLVWTHNCYSDYVLIFENSTSTGNGSFLQKLCGWFIPHPISSTKNMITIVFQSDGWMNRDGFRLNYTIVDTKYSCGGTFHSVAGEIKSPNFPDEYPPRKECIWIIQAPVGQQIRLNVHTFRLERAASYGSHKCTSDVMEIRNGGYDSSPLIGEFCGSNIPSTILSFSNALYIKFKSDDTISWQGFNISWDSSATGCGGILTAPTGAIISPNFPRTYGSHADCIWRISVAEGSRIELTILELELEDFINCNADYVEIYDGVNTNAKRLGLFCSKTNQVHILSTNNHMLIKFVSDYGEEMKGFRMNYTAVCNNELKGHRGVIESFNFPNPYPGNIDCYWNITATPGNNISIIFSHFDLEALVHTDCQSIDYLEVSDKPNIFNLGKFCGNKLPNAITFTTGAAYIHFHSEYSKRGNGFRLEWFLKGCGGVLKQSDFETFNSPGYPNPYPPNVVCEWYINMPHQFGIQLSISIMQIEASPSCQNDSLKIYGGPDDKAPLVANLCSNKFEMNTVSISGNHAFVRFTSDSSHGGKGFIASYHGTRSKCGGITQGTSGQIMSHNYPNNYGINEDCEWLVAVDRNHLINLTFIDFDIEPSHYGNINSVLVYDGSLTTDSVIFNSSGKLEELTSHSIMSAQSTINIRHVSDDSQTAKGFRAIYHEACGAHIEEATRGFLNHQSTPLDIYCEYYIMPSLPDSIVRLTVTRVQLKPEMNISLYDGKTDDDRKLLKVISGNHAPPVISSTGPAMTVKVFNPNRCDFDFEASYSVFDRECGGYLTSERGTITSPKYPDGYPLNVECIWFLSASPGNKVMLSFSEFSLENSPDGFCNEDYVEIRHKNNAGELQGLYCGDNIPINVTVSDSIWIKFRTDENGTAKGFVADYTLLHGNDLHGSSGSIASPLYPSLYRGLGTYEWTISVRYGYAVKITIIDFYIGHGHFHENCLNYIKIYDVSHGSDTALLKCGAQNSLTMISETSKVKIELNNQVEPAESMFYLNWEEVSQWSLETNGVITVNCTQLIWIDSDVGINNYTITNENVTQKCFSRTDYRSEYNWIIETSPFFHIMLDIVKMNWDCMQSRLDIYTEDNDGTWLLLTSQHHCPPQESMPLPTFNAKRRMKLRYVFDDYQATSFKAIATIGCGKEVTFQDRISLNTYHLRNHSVDVTSVQCEWIIQARPGRTIKIIFKNLTLPNSDIVAVKNNFCDSNYVIIRNGAYSDSPYLGIGKYCGVSLPSILETSSNKLHVTYHAWTNFLTSVGMSLDFVESSQSCDQEIHLNLGDHTSVSTPGYPGTPPAYITCIWKVFAPPGNSIHIKFNENIVFRKECEVEYLELRDGFTEASNVLQYLCLEQGPKSSQVTEGNVLLIKYFSDQNTPLPFTADVEVATCGGMYFITYSFVLIKSPNYPKSYPANSNCTWHIKTHHGDRLRLTFNELDVGHSTQNCSDSEDFLKVEQMDFFTNQPTGIKKVFCGKLNDNNEASSAITFNSSAIVIRFISTTLSEYTWSSKRHFSLQIGADRSDCYFMYETPSGFIESPGFPRQQTYASCSFRINVEQGRRIKIKFLDFDVDPSTQISVYQEYYMPWNISIIKPGDVYESLNNYMVIYYYASTHSMHRGFKAEYSSEEHSSCGYSLGSSGIINFPGQTNFTFGECMWQRISTETNITFSIEVRGTLDSKNYSSCYNSDISLCFTEDSCYADLATLCGQYITSATVVRSPFPITKIVMKHKNFKNLPTTTNFTLTYKTFPCGGVFETYENSLNITSPGYPKDYPTNMDCIWKVGLMMSVNTKVTFDFLDVDSSDDFVSVYVNGYSFASAHLVGKYHGTLIPESFTTSYGPVWVVFHSGSVKQGKGFRIIMTTGIHDCGGIENHNTGYITSPGFMSTEGYPSNIECEWEIHVQPGYHIGLTFPDRFQLEMSVNCSKDFVQVSLYEDDHWKTIGNKLCGLSSTKPVFNSTTNRMKVLFRSNERISGDGFSASWEANCGGRIDVPVSGKGVIMSPNYPNNYDGNLNCRYEIIAQGKIITGEFVHFALEEGDLFSCEKDNLTVTTYSVVVGRIPLRNYQRIGIHQPFRRYPTYGSRFYSYPSYNSFQRYLDLIPTSQSLCGTGQPLPVYSHDKLILTFKTDNFIENTGFFFKYSLESCGMANITKPTNIDIPKDEININCVWVVNAPRDKIVVLRFHNKVSIWVTDCKNNYIRVWTDSNTSIDICSDTPSSKLYSKSNNMTVQYIAQRSFSLHTSLFVYFSYECGSTISLDPTSSPKVISSLDTDHDGNYEPDLDCQWLVLAPLSYNVRVTFKLMDIDNCSNTTSCSCDYLKIYDGDSVSANKIGTFCGSYNYATVLSSMNELFIEFISDSTGSKPGFSLSLEPILSPCGIARHIITPGEIKNLTFPNGDQNYSNNINCTWILATNSTNKKIRIHFISLDIENSPNCTKDHLEIIDIGNSLFQKPFKMTICGQKAVDFLSSTNTVQVNFISDALVTGKGFKFEYSVDECQLNFEEPYGRIFVFKSYSTCRIHIKAPYQNNTISLYFTRFNNLLFSCHQLRAYLQVFDDSDSQNENKSVAKLCGYRRPKPIFSTGPDLFLLYSPLNTGGITFEILYTTSDQGQGCGGRLFGKEGTLTSPLYPNIYRNASVCRWDISVPHGYTLHFSFLDFNIGSPDTCNTDYLQIGETENDVGLLRWQYCGQNKPSDLEIQAGEVYIRYVTSIHNNGTGWELRFFSKS